MTIDIEAEVKQAAEYWTSEQERGSTDIPLNLLVITESGERVIIGFAEGMTDEMRPVFGQTVRRMVGQPIDAYVVTMTGWTSTRTDVRPADDPDRGEVLIVQGKTRAGSKAFRTYEMLRFGDEIRLLPLDLTQMEALTFDQILEA